MGTVIILVVFLCILFIILSHKKAETSIVSHWYYHFEDLQTSAEDFYTSIETHLADCAMPNIDFSREWQFEKNVLSSKRQYLRIHRGDNIFYVCAAPDGKCFFISCWMKMSQPLADFLEYIPLIGRRLAANARRRTFYEIDAQLLFNETIRLAVGKAVDHLAETKGVRIFPIENRIYA